ncbi:MAG: hypothetical protein ACYSWU_22640, partial [Planctomycetota bacterium]
MFRTTALALLLGVCCISPAGAQQEAKETPLQDDARRSPAVGESRDVVGETPEKQSDAERISRLERTIADNEKLLEDLKKKLDDPKAEFARAKTEFNELDQELEGKQKELQQSEDEGKAARVTTLQGEIEALQQRRKLSKDRFDLAFQERKTLQEQ